MEQLGQSRSREDGVSGRCSGDVAAPALSVGSSLVAPARPERARRVTILLFGIFLLSIADLAVTLTNLHSVGMVEANPVARFFILHTGTGGLIGYKMATVFVCLALLYRLRHHVQGEIATWLGLLILVGLSIYWGHYTERTHRHDVIADHVNGDVEDDRWLTLVD